jgi:hypothetical protein
MIGWIVQAEKCRRRHPIVPTIKFSTWKKLREEWRSSILLRTNLIGTSIGCERFKPFRRNSCGVNKAQYDSRQNCWFRNGVKPHASAL